MPGLAMTVPAYSLPLPGPTVRLASGHRVVLPMLGPLAGLSRSFLFTGILWFSHRRSLQATIARSRRFLVLTFAFLFLIVLLPASAVPYGGTPFLPWVAELYGFHLVAIACVNVPLWPRRSLSSPASLEQGSRSLR